MKKKIGIAVLVAAAVLAVALFLVFRGADKPAQANADEISLQIQLDLKEDIGLLADRLFRIEMGVVFEQEWKNEE